MNKVYVGSKLFLLQIICRAIKAVKGVCPNNPLRELIGIEKSLTGTVGLQVDEIYRLADNYGR